jgi:hypothetical protein
MLQAEFERCFDRGVSLDKLCNNTIFLIIGQIIQF